MTRATRAVRELGLRNKLPCHFYQYFISRINKTRQVKVRFVPVRANPVLSLVRARQKYSSLPAPSLDWLVQLTHSHQPGPPTTHP